MPDVTTPAKFHCLLPCMMLIKRRVFANFGTMVSQNAKLAELQKQLRQIVRDANASKLSRKEAADKIIAVREEMENILEALRNEQVRRY